MTLQISFLSQNDLWKMNLFCNIKSNVDPYLHFVSSINVKIDVKRIQSDTIDLLLHQPAPDKT